MPEQESVRCAKCRTPHHRTCFQEYGGCVAFGCTSAEEVVAGLSLFLRPKFSIQAPPTHDTDFGPFVLGYRRLTPIPEVRPRSRRPPPYARLAFKDRELREGKTLSGRGVFYVPTEARVRRVELHLYQGLSRPRFVARHVLSKEGAARLEEGSHPFHLELRAPDAVPPMDPFLIELAVVQGLLRVVRSAPLPVFLLQARDDEPPPPPPLPLRIRSGPRPARAAARPARAPAAGDPLA
ncbi:MAG: hypothetical protein D6731_01150, partial [Planctomycetota bacterium]